MKYLALLFLILTSSTVLAENPWNGSYELVSDVCYEKKTPLACDPLFRTTLNKINLRWSVGRNPSDGSIYIEAIKQVPSYYWDTLSPVGYFSNHSAAETKNSVTVYKDSATVRRPDGASSICPQTQIQFLPEDSKLTIRILGVDDFNCEAGLFDQILREMTFQKTQLNN